MVIPIKRLQNTCEKWPLMKNFLKSGELDKKEKAIPSCREAFSTVYVPKISSCSAEIRSVAALFILLLMTISM
ncbi:hypothetical protein AS030_03235 [Fictibacillus enclensis]|uniref:Uncharacterized protein n=1 Tax=Fictibacillus enclensis TaxID=1017270 RepID=A0A0V8JC64_9BACL|nr:hypothetical protein AS030_03235 [Fictibacillus enclensis]